MTAAVHETRSASETRPLLVNLGCGGRIHADWANYDLSPTAPGIRRANFISGIPLHDASADFPSRSLVVSFWSASAS